MSFQMPLPLPTEGGGNKIAAVWDKVKAGWAAMRSFPRVLSNTVYLSWPGFRGAYDDFEPISDDSVTQVGVQKGVKIDDNSASALYAMPAMGYNRVRIIARGTGSAGQTFGVQAFVWRDETANQVTQGLQLASGIPADGEWHLVDSDAYLGPWCQIKVYAEGEYTLTDVTVTLHFWKE